MSDIPTLTQEENLERRKQIIKKLKETPKEECLTTVFVEDFKQQFIKDLDLTLTDSMKRIWFPDESVRVNLEKVTSDLRDTDSWKNILQQYKEGKIDDEDMVDVIVLSHLSVDPSVVDPIRVHERQVEKGLKSRVGAKFIKRLVDTTNNAMKNSFAALCETLQLENRPETLKLLGTNNQSSETGLIPVNEQVQDALRSLGEQVFNKQDEVELVKQFFAGDMLYDRLIDVSYDDLLDKLMDADDYEFDTARTLIVDMGMEQQNRVVERTDYDSDPEGLRFVVYIVWLANIFDGFGGTHSDDRGIHKYRIHHSIDEIQFLTLMNSIKHRYDLHVEGRTESSQSRMGWRNQKELHAKITSPYYRLTPYDKDVLLRTTIQVLKNQGGLEDLKCLFEKVNIL